MADRQSLVKLILAIWFALMGCGKCQDMTLETSTWVIDDDVFDTTPTNLVTTSEKIPIYLGGFLSVDSSIWDGSGMLPAIELALDHINSRPDVLARYELRMVWNDSKCDAGLGTRFLFEQLFHEPQKIMIIGPACSTDAQAVAQTSFYWNLITVSYSAASSSLSNRDRYPYFFRTYVPDAMYNPVRIMLMERFNWTRVATIHTNFELFSLAMDNLWTLLKRAGIENIASESFGDSPTNQMEQIKASDAHIIVANMYEGSAVQMFCEAYHLGMYGENYMWILIGWYGRHWWRDQTLRGRNMTCTPEEVQEVVLRSMYISTEVENIDRSGKKTVSGYTASEIMEMYEDRLTWPEYEGLTASGLDYFSYDATWGIALALNQSSAIMETEGWSNDSMRNLEDFNYDDKEMADLMFQELQRLQFQGATGHVSFAYADRVGLTRVEQLQGSCKEGWHFYGIHCYRFIANNTLPWSEARAACHGYSEGYLRDSVLAPITSKKEFEFLLETWQGLSVDDWQWHFGLHQQGSSLRWADITKDEPEWLPEAPIFVEPVSINRCFSFDFRDGGSWIVTRCEDVARPYICRKIADFEERYITTVVPSDPREPDFSLLKWPGGFVPLDHSPGYEYLDVHEGITLTLYLPIGGVTVACILMALTFLAFNIYFSKQRFVKLSSPKLNNLILVGSVLIYLSILMAGLGIQNLPFELAEECMIRNWLVSIGFVLSFGAMFSKTWRVHRVATFKTPKRRIVTDQQLFGIVGFLLLLDVAILTSWQIMDPQRLVTITLPEKPDPDVEMQILRPYVRVCASDQTYIWSSILYGYKGVLLIFGTFLAWETRKVTIPALNDSKLIGLSVYNVIILCVIGLGVSFALGEDPGALFLFISCIMLFCTTVTLIVIFVPKIIGVYKDPAGEKAIVRNGGTNSETIRAPSTINTEMSEGQTKRLLEEISALKKQVTQLKEQLSQQESGDDGSFNSSKDSFEEQPSCSDWSPPTLPEEDNKGCGVWMGGLPLGFEIRSMGKATKGKYNVDGNSTGTI